MKKINPYLYLVLVAIIMIVIWLDFLKGGTGDKTRIILALGACLVVGGIFILISEHKRK